MLSNQLATCWEEILHVQDIFKQIYVYIYIYVYIILIKTIYYEHPSIPPGRVPAPWCPLPQPLALAEQITLPYITLHYIALHYHTLHYITLNYITLHCIELPNTLHCIALHYPTLHLRRGDESQPRARIFLFPKRPLTIPYEQKPKPSAAPLEAFSLLCNPSPPFLSITSHPLANYLVPNPNGCCSPLSFGVPPYSPLFTMFLMIFLRLLLVFSNIFPAVPPLSSVFLLRNLP